MCGIIAYCGEENAQPVILSGLKKLEYRGYDSVGMACAQVKGLDAGFAMYKEVGKVEDLERLCEEHSLQGFSGIGHCRWATHGAVTWANAHPHLSFDGQVILVHNGIIENYLELRRFLEGEGLVFQSEGDTETVANLLAYLLQVGQGRDLSPAATRISARARLHGEQGQDLALRALQSLPHWLKGAYALAIMFAARPDEIYAVRCESPLVLGLGQRGNYLASDVLPILDYSREVIYLQNHEIVRLRRPGDSGDSAAGSGFAAMQLYDAAARRLEPSTVRATRLQKLQESAEVVDKQGYQHFMAKEIYEQPRVFRDLFRRHVDAHGWRPRFAFDEQQEQKLRGIQQIVFVSCGTSYHSSVYAKYLLEKYCGIAVRVEYASEFRYREPLLGPHTLVIGLSQSGETADTLAALRLAKDLGAATLGLVNVASSSIARMVDILLCSHCGPEIGVASTKVYTAQLLILYYLTFYLAHLRGLGTRELVAQKLQESQKLAVFAGRILSQADSLRELGRAYAGYQHMLYLGRGLYYPLALEGALKLKELSYIHAEAYAAAEMKHGPIALIDNRMPVLVLVPSCGTLYEKMQSNIAEVKARGGRILAFVGAAAGSQETEEAGAASFAELKALYNDHFVLPSISEELDVLILALPLQLFAYHIAVVKGIDPDQPRNLAKSVTVE